MILLLSRLSSRSKFTVTKQRRKSRYRGHPSIACAKGFRGGSFQLLYENCRRQCRAREREDREGGIYLMRTLRAEYRKRGKSGTSQWRRDILSFPDSLAESSGSSIEGKVGQRYTVTISLPRNELLPNINGNERDDTTGALKIGAAGGNDAPFSRNQCFPTYFYCVAPSLYHKL